MSREFRVSVDRLADGANVYCGRRRAQSAVTAAARALESVHGFAWVRSIRAHGPGFVEVSGMAGNVERWSVRVEWAAAE